MKINLIAHTQLSEDFCSHLLDSFIDEKTLSSFTDGQAVALTAIRTCYSPNKPSEIIEKEAYKYFGREATDGKGGTDADRLFRHIVNSGHTSTLEHLSFTFAIEGVSRALLAQLTRHRVGFSYSVQSQRYVRFGSGDKTGGFDYVVPESVTDDEKESKSYVWLDYQEDENGHYQSVEIPYKALELYEEAMKQAQFYYNKLREAGVPPEDARMVIPNAAATNLVMTANLRALLDFYSKRRKGRGAQAEIAELAEQLRKTVVEVEPWTDAFFEQA